MAPMKTAAVTTPATTTTTTTPVTTTALLQNVQSTLSKSLDTSLSVIGKQLQTLGVNLPQDQQEKLSMAVGLTGVGATLYILNKICSKIMRMLTLPKPSIAKKDYDVVIVGGGIGGCALGSALSKAGKNVLVLERDMSEPDRIIGELLQPGGVQHLKDLGLGHCLEGIDAARVFGYQVFYGDEQVNLPYPADSNSKVGEKVEGRSFHYGRFIMNLRRACEQDG